MKQLVFLLFIGLANISFGQVLLDSLVVDLANKYYQKCNADWDESLSQDETEKQFHKSFKNLLNTKGFTAYLFDSTHNFSVIEKQKNSNNDSFNNLIYFKKKLLNSSLKEDSFVVFSISNCPGGNTSEYLNYGIYRIKKDSCNVQLLDTINTMYFSPGYYKMETIKSGKETYYLFISISNSGIRKQYGFSIYQYSNQRLIKCSNCFPKNRSGLHISLQRNQSFDSKKKEFIPHFWLRKKTLTLKQYDFDSYTGFHANTFQIIKLKFHKGKFKFKGKTHFPFD